MITTMVAAQAAPNDYEKILTDEEEDEGEKETLNETLDLSGKPLTLKIGNPHNGAFPLLLQHKEGRLLQKGETKLSPFIQWDIFLDLMEGEIDGP